MNGTARTSIILEVDESKCHACRKCLAGKVCKANAFKVFDPGEAPFIDTSRCWGCFLCIPACPFDAIVRHDYSGEDDNNGSDEPKTDD